MDKPATGAESGAPLRCRNQATIIDHLGSMFLDWAELAAPHPPDVIVDRDGIPIALYGTAYNYNPATAMSPRA